MTYCAMHESSFSVRPRQGRDEPGDEEGRDEVGGGESEEERGEVGGVEPVVKDLEALTRCAIIP
jgi:hypothetical protein